MATNFGGGNLEVSEVASRPQVLREGRLVRAITVDHARAEDMLRDLRVIPRPSLPRVVTQGVPAGTLVKLGSTVDLTLVRPTDIRFDLFGVVHAGFANKTVAQVLTAQPPAVTTILGAKEQAADLTPAERTAVAAFLDAQGVATAGGTGVSSFESVYNLMQDIQVFR
jgi:hypothetical protein